MVDRAIGAGIAAIQSAPGNGDRRCKFTIRGFGSSRGIGEKTGMTEITETPAPEFPRLITAEDARNGPLNEHFTASPDERAALARRFDVDAIENLEADVRLRAFRSGNRVRLEAKFTAEIRQTCVVTLEPVVSRIETEFSREYAPPAFVETEAEVIVDPDAEDPPESIPETGIDAGEAIAEQLGLEIEPFPRAPGAEFEAHTESNEAEHPFAKLKNLIINEG
ncbi:MAG: hypothetical protein CMM10_06570 [Rhodospirillaceae bacterium]|nr:hypothetical protein [Rhodospirillaceae bacterium]